MNDLKEFLDKECNDNSCDGYNYINRESLGLFYWNRRGKQFIEQAIKMNYSLEIKDLKQLVGTNIFNYKGQDFLDALDCLGEIKIKELIEELK